MLVTRVILSTASGALGIKSSFLWKQLPVHSDRSGKRTEDRERQPVCVSVLLPDRFANRGNYEKAILDFEKALGEDPNHQNAKKYMGETLVAQAKA